ncbi:MAG: UDP-glucose 4-epimerase GalE [Nitritalea sp.]
MQKVLITGGAGYIGSHTAVKLIENGITPIIVDNFNNSERFVLERLEEITKQKIICYEGDCNDLAFMDALFGQEKLEGVIHFAAYKAVGESTQKPLNYYENNVGSLVVLLRLMEKYKVKNLVFSSSCTVYGQPDILPVSEETPRKPAESPYGNTKKICEDILHDVISSQSGLKIISLRYFNPIGAHPSALIGELPRGVPNNLIPYITQTAIGLREKLSVFGSDYATPDGTCVRDYIHVMDLADAHLKALEYVEKQPDNFIDLFNVGTGNGNTVLEVIQAFESASGQKLRYELTHRRPGDVEQVWADTKKINALLGWQATFSLTDALRDAWRWQLALSER